MRNLKTCLRFSSVRHTKFGMPRFAEVLAMRTSFVLLILAEFRYYTPDGNFQVNHLAGSQEAPYNQIHIT